MGFLAGLPVSVLSAGASALVLGGCAQPSAKPTTSLPITAPDGASDVVTEFVEVCSQALLDPARIGGVLAERDWQPQSGPDGANAMAGMLGAEHSGLDLSLQVMPLDYPHVQGTSCSVLGYRLDDFAAADLSALDKLPGFLGSLKTFNSDGEDMSLGRWSAIGPDGEPITVSATLLPDNTFLNLNMNHARRVTPDADTKQ